LEEIMVRAVRSWIPVVGLLALGAAACDQTPVSLPEAENIVVTPANSEVMLGEATTVSAQVVDQRGNVVRDAQPTWTSADPSVAGVTSDGFVTARSVGSTTLTASYGGLTSSVEVTVVPDDLRFVQSVNVLQDDVAMHVHGGSERVVFQAFDGRGNRNCTGATGAFAESSDRSVVTASVSGCSVWLNPEGPGSATVTLTVDDATETLSVTVTAEGLIVEWTDTPSADEATAGNTVTYELRIRDQADEPMAGTTVNFQVDRGLLSSTSVTTDADGRASVEWRLPRELRDGTGAQDFENVQITARFEGPAGNTVRRDDWLTVNAGEVADIKFYQYGAGYSVFTAVGGTVEVPTNSGVWFGARAYDSYGNQRQYTWVDFEHETDDAGALFYAGPMQGCGNLFDGCMRYVYMTSSAEQTVTLTAIDTDGDAADEDSNVTADLVIEFVDSND
jgi:hypothetical protein